MPISKPTGSDNLSLSVNADEAGALRNRVFAALGDLPAQSDIDTADFADQPIWEDMLMAGLLTPKQAQALKDEYPRFGDFLDDHGQTAFRIPMIGRKRVGVIADFIRARYGFVPEIGPQHADSALHGGETATELDVAELDARLAEVMASEIDYSDIHMHLETLQKLQEAGIRTVGDYLAVTDTQLRQAGISAKAVKGIQDYVRETFGIDKQQITKDQAVHRTVAFKNLVLKKTRS